MTWDWILTVELIGSFCMGVFVAWIAFFFLNREKDFTAKEFGEFVGVFFGGAIVQLYSSQVISTQNAWIFWIYPIGLLCGMIFYAAKGGNIRAKFPLEIFKSQPK